MSIEHRIGKRLKQEDLGIVPKISHQMKGLSRRSQTSKRQDDDQSVNEIIVKVEMKKFQNLVNNRLRKKNNLVNLDVNRIYPINKIALEKVKTTGMESAEFTVDRPSPFANLRRSMLDLKQL